MKRSQRVAVILNTLSQSPHRLFALSHFCQLLQAAKSTISEDISIAKNLCKDMKLGEVQTIPGAGGGVLFIPLVSKEYCEKVQEELCQQLRKPSRILGGGFLYTSDLMFDPEIAQKIAPIFAQKFRNSGANYVITIETKGIPIALMTAKALHLPMVVVRRESKVSEGATVSINYFSGSNDRIQKMSMAKKAVVPGSKALIIDDFMRGGGSLKGITELLGEFDVSVCGIGVVISAIEPKIKKIHDYFSLLYLGQVDEQQHCTEIIPNQGIFGEISCQR